MQAGSTWQHNHALVLTVPAVELDLEAGLEAAHSKAQFA